jgi:DNA-binding CsgD family transcriptional regulator
MEVVRHVVQGLSNPRNRRADVHHPWSVKTHLAHIFAKLGTASRAELAAEAAKRGIGV